MRCAGRPLDQAVSPTRSDADMRHTIITGRHDAHHAIAVAVWIVAAFWIVAGIVAVIALDGGLTRLAVALAVVTTEWWLISQVQRGIEHRMLRHGLRRGSSCLALRWVGRRLRQRYQIALQVSAFLVLAEP